MSEYEALLLSYAEEKAHLVSEIETLRMELSANSSQVTFNETQGSLLDSKVAIQSQVNKDMSRILNERMKEGSSLLQNMEEAIITQSNRNFEILTENNNIRS